LLDISAFKQGLHPYLELAQREGLPLATLDADLQKAAVADGVALVSHGAGI